MKSDDHCPKCGSKERVPGVRVIDRGNYNGDAGDIQVGIYRQPSAVLFKGKVTTNLSAHVCAGCGFTELYASDPQAILSAWKEAKHT